jgi:DNA-binding PadR family transcriptional regulator
LKRQALTELEQCVLGVIWRDGPMTAYEIAALFAASLSPYWSGSAGAIYPVVARLRERGVVRGKSAAWNGTRKTMLSISPKGIDTLRAWLTPPLPAEAGMPSFDPLRTRFFFVELLDTPGQEALLDDAERVIHDELALVRTSLSDTAASGAFTEHLGALGVQYELEARLRWVSEVRERLRARALPR